MTAVPPPTPPSGPPPPSAPLPPPGATPPPVGVPPPPGKGLSTGVKIAIGCAVLVVLALIVVSMCTMFVGKKVKDLGHSMESGVEQQQKAQAKVAELEKEHPFTPPADGTLDEDQVERFFAVTDDAWDKVKPWVEDMEKRGERLNEPGERGGFRDAVTGVRGLAQARVALAEAMDDHDMPPSAYVWTGYRLMQAYEAQVSGTSDGVPQKNLDIASKNSDRLSKLKESEGKAGKGTVLGLAFTLYPRPDLMLPPGADTLLGTPR